MMNNYNYNQNMYEEPYLPMQLSLDEERYFSRSNDYLRMVFNPSQNIVNVPDLDMTPTHLKPLTVGTTIEVGDTGSCLLLWTPHSFGPTLRLFVWDGNEFVFWSTIPFDEDLSANYSWARPIAGCLFVDSDTVSGTDFTISGQINAARYNFLPPVNELNHQEIPSYKSDPKSVVTSVRLSDGVACLMHPTGDHEFHPLATNAITNGTNILTATMSALIPGDTIADFTRGVDFPPNITGQFNFGGNFVVESTFTGTLSCNIFFTYRASTGTWSNSSDVTVLRAVVHTTTLGDTFTLTIDEDVDIPGFLNNIRVQLFNGTFVNVGRLRLKSTTYYEIGRNSPGTMISIRGASEGQSIAIGGTINYEVVPDANLSRQIMTSVSNSVENPWELEIAEWFIAGPMYNTALAWVSPLPRYNSMIASGQLDRIITNERVLSSGGFPEWLKKLFKAVAPLAGTGMSMLTSNPMLGGQVTTALQELGSGGSYRNLNTGGTIRKRNRSRLNAAGEMDSNFLAWSEAIYEAWTIDETRTERSSETFANFLNHNSSPFRTPQYNSTEPYRVGKLQGNLPDPINVIAFPAVDQGAPNADGQIGFICLTDEPFTGEYVTYVGGEDLVVHINSNVILAKDTLSQIFNAVEQAQPVFEPYVSINVAGPRSLSGPSIGLAANMIFSGIHTNMCVTGALMGDKPIGVNFIKRKLEIVHAFNDLLDRSGNKQRVKNLSLGGLVALYDSNDADLAAELLDMSEYTEWELSFGLINSGERRKFFPVTSIGAASMICLNSLVWSKESNFSARDLMLDDEGKVTTREVIDRTFGISSGGQKWDVADMEILYTDAEVYIPLTESLGTTKESRAAFNDSLEIMMDKIDEGDFDSAANVADGIQSRITKLTEAGWLDEADSVTISNIYKGEVRFDDEVVSARTLKDTDYASLMTEKAMAPIRKWLPLWKKYNNLEKLAAVYKSVVIIPRIATTKAKREVTRLGGSRRAVERKVVERTVNRRPGGRAKITKVETVTEREEPTEVVEPKKKYRKKVKEEREEPSIYISEDEGLDEEAGLAEMEAEMEYLAQEEEMEQASKPQRREVKRRRRRD